MPLVWSTALVVNAASGAILFALGLAVALVRPRRPASRAFGGFAIAFGAGFIADNVGMRTTHEVVGPLLTVASGLAFVLAAGFLVRVAFHAPRPLSRGGRGVLVVPAVAAGLVATAHTVLLLADNDARRAQVDAAFALGGVRLPQAAVHAHAVGLHIVFGALLFVLLALAWRYRSFRGDEPAAREAALMSAGLAIYAGFAAGAGVWGPAMSALAPTPGARVLGALALAGVLVVCVAWIVNTACGPLPRTARNVALLLPFVAFLGLAKATTGTGGFEWGLARTVGAAILGYAIVRHQLLGLDLRIKWTIRQSTLAATFIAVFFVASEAAQQFLGETLGSTYVGIAAAGALVFALAPLQRLAERVSEKAMPGVRPLAVLDADERLRVYREQAMAAWADGGLSRDERMLLDRLRDSLGLDLKEAARIESEAATVAPPGRRCSA